jgi:RNA polymerase sigma-70 factor, ECF subfamily
MSDFSLPLTRAFSSASAVAIPPSDTIELALVALLARARQAWPTVSLPDAAFAVYLGQRWSGEAPTPARLEALPAEDLYLACGCVRGEPPALVAFRDTYGDVIRIAVRGVELARDRVDDAVQLTLARLLVASADEAPRITQYSGRSKLVAFVRVVASRVALSMLRADPRGHVGAEALADVKDDHDDPELRFLKQLYRDEFRAAFAAAITGLSERDRLLLRCQIVDRFSIDQIAAIYGQPRSTVGRHLQAAHGRLVADTRARLRENLKIGRPELSSVLRLVESSVEVSVRRLLGADGHDGLEPV